MTVKQFFRDLLDKRHAHEDARQLDEIMERYQQLRDEPPEPITTAYRVLAANPYVRHQPALIEWFHDCAKAWGAPDDTTAHLLVSDVLAKHGSDPDTLDSWRAILDEMRVRAGHYLTLGPS